ncbi:hypothetical protein BX600DRAFT_464800 [Xylariales sp. PMI_506]|nr:hypothetical protein BX600DRAFT_464800 [Xylariales sp. PMI_506]
MITKLKLASILHEKRFTRIFTKLQQDSSYLYPHFNNMTRSSTTTSEGRPTPSSDSVNSRNNVFIFSGGLSGGIPTAHGNPRSNPDRVIPSIEQEADQDLDGSGSSTSNFMFTPSLTPNGSDLTSNLCGSSVDRSGSDASHNANAAVGRLRSRLRNLELSTSSSARMGMGDLATAIEGVGNGQRSRTGSSSLQVPGSSPDPQDAQEVANRGLAYRRRSSSRVYNRDAHDVKDEKPPNDRFLNPEFQKSFETAKRIMSDLATTLASSSLHVEPDSTMQRLHQRAGQLANFRCPSTRIVGFVGDSGVGKSSVLNSLLDFKRMARTSNSGAACTCVITEYHYHEAESFTVEIELFTEAEIMQQIGSLLRSYRHYHLNKDEMDAENSKNMAERAQVAQDTFIAMFRDRLTGNQALLTESSETSVLKTLTAWMRDRAPLTMNTREVRSSLSDCSKVLAQLTSEDIATKTPAVWPYIKKIKVFSNAYILSRGLILVDLPGLRDLNSARRDITERYLLNCHEIFVVCNIGRAITDAGVMSVFDLAAKANLVNIGIICTKSDDIQPEEAEQDAKGKTATEIRRKREAIEEQERRISETKLNLDDLDEIGEDDMTQEEINEQNRLNQELRIRGNQLADLEFELLQCIINARNQVVTEQLRALYRNKVPNSRALHVFCVSNALYWGHRVGPKVKELPFLALSGILSVREHCMEMVSESQYLIAKAYMQDDISALLGDIELWVLSGSGSLGAETKAAIRETLDVLEARLRRDLCGNTSDINSIARSFVNNFRTRIQRPGRTKISAWSATATRASYDWSSWHHASYSAFCRNYGDHVTATIGARNWNQEAIRTMVIDLSPKWRELCISFQEHNERMINHTREVMDWAIQYLDTELQSSSGSIGNLGPVIMSHENLLVGEIWTACNDFDDKTRILTTDALSTIRSSFILRAMDRAYQDAIHESGSGSDRRRKNIINGTVGREGLFEGLLRDFEKGFAILATELQEKLQATVRSHLDDLKATLDMVRSENVALESEKNPEFRGRVEVCVIASKDKMESIRASL